MQLSSEMFLQFNEFFGNGTRTLNSLATICILRSSISCRPKAQNKLTNSESFSPIILKKTFTRFLVKPRYNPKGLMQFGQLLQFKGIHRSSSKKELVPWIDTICFLRFSSYRRPNAQNKLTNPEFVLPIILQNDSASQPNYCTDTRTSLLLSQACTK
jgi:hypothetical protein